MDRLPNEAHHMSRLTPELSFRMSIPAEAHDDQAVAGEHFLELEEEFGGHPFSSADVQDEAMAAIMSFKRNESTFSTSGNISRIHFVASPDAFASRWAWRDVLIKTGFRLQLAQRTGWHDRSSVMMLVTTICSLRVVSASEVPPGTVHRDLEF